MPLLEVKNLRASYGAIRALRDVSFTLDAGQVVSLIGANGAGKSTTLNTISGLLKPDGGSVHFQGKDITGMAAHRVTRLGLVQVPEGRQVVANMSVLKNLTLGAKNRHNQVDSMLADIFRRFPRLEERRDQQAGLLSGGEQQMLAVGRALMMQPEVLMLDEPSMGLAPLLVKEVFRIIANIKAQGIPILLVEQNARQAMQVADYVYVLDRGTVVDHGPADQMRENKDLLASYLG